MVGGYGKIKLGPLKTPGQIVAAALSPIGYLSQGSRAGQVVTTILAPHHQLLLSSQKLSHKQQVAAVQRPALDAIQQGQVQPVETVQFAPTAARSGAAWPVVGAAVVAGVLLLAAAYFRKRSR